MTGVYSVSQVNTYIKNIFSRDAAFARITVRGEVSNCRYLDAGHIYFTLKDEQAAISCVCFQSSRAGLTFRLANGQKIDATGQISVYEKTGVYQLYLRTAVLAGTGDLYERFLKLRDALGEMGMFDAGYKKAIPTHAARIGIVTAEGGAAIQDIIRVSRQKNPYVKLYLKPALVQGQYAAEDIASSLKFLDSLGLDVLIVGRGGGSIEDLWAFNEEIVAKAIFDCVTPVISAVGHETDFTIADYVADLRAATPTQAAELANFDYAAFEEQCSAVQAQLDRLLRFRLNRERQRLETAGARLERMSPGAKLLRLKDRMENCRNRLDSGLKGKQDDAERRMERLEKRLQRAMERKDERAVRQFSQLAGRLDAGSPLKKITGGYGYLMSSGKSVRHAAQVEAGEELIVYLADGRIISQVIRTEEAMQAGAERKLE